MRPRVVSLLALPLVVLSCRSAEPPAATRTSPSPSAASGNAAPPAVIARDSNRKSVAISGRVTSETGAPLAAVQLFIPELNTGSQTGSDGTYAFVVPAMQVSGQSVTLRARIVGYLYRNVQIKLDPGATVRRNFRLAVNPLRLGEVVVTGAGTVSATEKLGGARSAADALELGRADELVVVEALAAKPQANAAQEFSGRGASGGSASGRSASLAGSFIRVRGTQPAGSPPPADAARDFAASGEESRSDTRPAQGALRARDGKGKPVGDFPLRHTEVSAEISGYLARTVVEQRYTNPFTQAIEAVYVFPLGAMSAVSDFVMVANGRRIVGVVRPREEAERIYAQARARGQTASLLTQERPNIFTQNVANIAPGGAVTVRITYVERLPYERGRYEYVFPMVVGPRYVGGTPLLARGGERERPGSGSLLAPVTRVDVGGRGVRAPTTRVPDADRISPPVLLPGQRSGHDIDLTVRLDAGLPLRSLDAVTHRVAVTSDGPTRRGVRLAAWDSIPNRDFVLRWSVAGEETQFGVLAHRDGTGGYFTLAMQPPLAPSDRQVTPREITFVMDVSGSMHGLPLDISKDVVRRTLDRLRPDDRFNIVYFSGANAQLWDRARENTTENVALARRFLDGLQGGGGTEMLAGVRRAIAAMHDPAYLQMFVLMTDGYIGEEADVLRLVKEERGGARFFAFGIGSGVNRHLIDGVGESGGGASYVVLPRDPERADNAAARLFDVIDSPVLVDVDVDWNGLPVSDVYPSKPRDLFAGQTIALVGRFASEADGTAYVTGRVGKRRVRYPVRVRFHASDSANSAIRFTWARSRIHELSTAMLGAEPQAQDSLRRAITELAVRHHVVSQYTAFVAVDESRVVGTGRPLAVLQPVEIPEGVNRAMATGESAAGSSVRVGAWGLSLVLTSAGAVRVVDVLSGSAAARAGIARGAALKTVNRTLVHDLAHLEALLLQARPGVVRVGFEPGTAVELRTP